MSFSRLFEVLRVERSSAMRRPMFWVWIIVAALACLGLSTGTMRIGQGNSAVGVAKVWLTSEFTNAQVVTMFWFLVYTFFVAVVAGFTIIRDQELRISEILHSTRLKPSEYVWGKFGAALLITGIVLSLHVLFSIFFNHLMPIPFMQDVRGPFSLRNYLVPALVFGAPMMIFFAGACFAIGEITRKSVLVFFVPIALVPFCGFFLWDWSPSWLSPRINHLLMLIDPAGRRWLQETWMKVDRGAAFYNHATLVFDVPFLLSRLAFVAVGLAAVAFVQVRFSRKVRGTSRGAAFSPATLPAADEEQRPSAEPLSALAMTANPPGYFAGLIEIARVEAKQLAKQPGLYVFALLIVFSAIATASLGVGPFDTPLLLTSGYLAVNSFDPINVYVMLLLLFYIVESLNRETICRIASVSYATPVKTISILGGKALANGIIVAAILFASFAGGAIATIAQGKVKIEIWPFILVWGLILFPSVLFWSALMTAIQATTGNRYSTYALGLAVLAFFGYLQLSGKANWVTNWMLWGTLKWTDMGGIPIDRSAIVLNRIAAIGFSVLFIVFASRMFPRRERDSARTVVNLQPGNLLRSALRLSPYLLIPVIVCTALWIKIQAGYEGNTAKDKGKDYWKQNLATWKDARLPAISFVDLKVDLDPNQCSFHMNGSYDLVNTASSPLARFPVTCGMGWEDISWTLNGTDYKPEDRSHLFVITPAKPLQPNEHVTIGFSYDGVFPKGISRDGASVSQFILPSGVVLNSFGPNFAPQLGYDEGIGVNDDNRYEAKEYPDDFYEGVTPGIGGLGYKFKTRIQVSGPAEYMMNSNGILKSNTVENGRRTELWESDQPVNCFNIIAGRWAVRKGNGTVIYYYPGHTYNIDEMIKALDAAKEYFSKWFCPFPWDELRISEFPNMAVYAQAIATNISFSEGIGFLAKSDPRSDIAFLVTAHETAHQWWGVTVTPGEGPGGNILSEGLAHFSTLLLMDQVNGPERRAQLFRQFEKRYNDNRKVDLERPMVKTDGSRDGDNTVTYDKGGTVFWMMLEMMGRDAMLQGLQAYAAKYKDNPDHPVLQDFAATMRDFAPDKEAYDQFIQQWFFQVLVPEYRLSNPERKQSGNSNEWQVDVKVKNIGTAKMPVEIAAVSGDKSVDSAKAVDYKECHQVVVLGAGEEAQVSIKCTFKPDRVVVDPDAKVLQLRRAAAIAQF